MESGIYKIVCNATQGVYIGQSIDVDNRLKTHLNELKNNNHCNKELQEDFNSVMCEILPSSLGGRWIALDDSQQE